ncbi:hypothetical protein [Rhizobium wuzhouense]|uniref:DUF2336 domain-containing protein n=1 Tax=Rhizobium wuzhouense TaxID=1986026 RepID=A0ABX5NPX0_9HYPH|nr:hypothetical protein [Rhizobium wuzhouense]PYB70079.1 hypothetical protein DMY87_22650 [Rhizobium wuzhouense]
MIGPVSAPTNLYQQPQESRTQAETRTTGRAPVAAGVEPYPASAAGSIAGNLNMMLLSAPERMSQNLVVLTEVLAAALKMKQEPGEPLTAFAARLIEAITTLAPAERQKLKVMLSDAFAGLQLRTLLQALHNPQGPEAATLAIYLELYRQKDRDPGARAVISSYRQNGGMSLGQPPRDARAAGQQASQAVPMPARPSSQSPASLSSQMTPAAVEISATRAPPAAVRRAGEQDGRHATGEPSRGGEQASANDGSDNLRVLRQMRDRLNASAEPAQTDRIPVSARKAADPAAAFMANAQPGATRSTGPASPTMAPSLTSPPNAQVEPHEPDGKPEAGSPTLQQTLSTLPSELLDDMAESDLIRTLLALYGSEVETDVVDRALDALMPSEPEETDAKRLPSQTTPPAETLADDSEAPALDRPIQWEERLALGASTLPSHQGEAARRADVGDGLPLAFVNYVIDSEVETKSASPVRRDAHEEEHPDEAADEEPSSDEDAAEDPPDQDTETLVFEGDASGPDDRIDLGLAAPQLDAADARPALPHPDEDPAQALYRRLSDFA